MSRSREWMRIASRDDRAHDLYQKLMRIETRLPVVKEFAMVAASPPPRGLLLASCCRGIRTGDRRRPLKLNRFNVSGCLRGRLASSVNSSDNRLTFSSESGSGGHSI